MGIAFPQPNGQTDWGSVPGFSHFASREILHARSVMIGARPVKLSGVQGIDSRKRILRLACVRASVSLPHAALLKEPG